MTKIHGHLNITPISAAVELLISKPELCLLCSWRVLHGFVVFHPWHHQLDSCEHKDSRGKKNFVWYVFSAGSLVQYIFTRFQYIKENQWMGAPSVRTCRTFLRNIAQSLVNRHLTYYVFLNVHCLFRVNSVTFTVFLNASQHSLRYCGHDFTVTLQQRHGEVKDERSRSTWICQLELKK